MYKDFQALLLENIESLRRVDNKLPVIVVVNNLQTAGVEYMSSYGLEILNTTLEQLKRLGSEYHKTYFNSDEIADYSARIPELLKEAKDDKIFTYFQQARSAADQDWTWYLSTTKVFMRDKNNLATHLITCAAPIDPIHQLTSKINRLLEENNFLRKHQLAFASLTKREQEVLKLTALGDTSAEIAEKLHISEQTAITHRRNIRAKLNPQSNYDFTRFAQAFNLI